MPASSASSASQPHSEELKQLLKLARQFDGRLNSTTSNSPTIADLKKALNCYSKANQILPSNNKISERVKETQEKLQILLNSSSKREISFNQDSHVDSDSEGSRFGDREDEGSKENGNRISIGVDSYDRTMKQANGTIPKVSTFGWNAITT